MFMCSLMAQYLLGDLMPDESQRIEEALSSNYRLRRDLEATMEKLTAAYVLGRLSGKDRLKFETAFLASEEGKPKIKFARAWVEEGGSARPDLTSPPHRYVFGDMTTEEEHGLEEKLLTDERLKEQLEIAENEVLIAYFREELPERERELFEENYLINDRIVGKLRFAEILLEYERASVAPSSTPENGAGAGRRRLGNRQGTSYASKGRRAPKRRSL